MLARLIFFLLLLANIGFYGWQLAIRSPRPEPLAAGLPPDVPRLALLREREREILAAPREPAADPAFPRGLELSCSTVGPFSNQADLRRAFNDLAADAERIRQRQSVETRDRGLWVYLPAVDSREEALRVARELSAAGFRDYYVVTAGAQENTISLGLFREQENAQRRMAALRALGFDARITRRSEEALSYWLDVAVPSGAEPAWERILGAGPGARRLAIGCEQLLQADAGGD